MGSAIYFSVLVANMAAVSSILLRNYGKVASGKRLLFSNPCFASLSMRQGLTRANLNEHKICLKSFSSTTKSLQEATCNMVKITPSCGLSKEELPLPWFLWFLPLLSSLHLRWITLYRSRLRYTLIGVWKRLLSIICVPRLLVKPLLGSVLPWYTLFRRSPSEDCFTSTTPMLVL